MKNLKNAKISGGGDKEKEVFRELVETVFLFIHEHYAEYGSILKDYDINYTQYVTLITVYMHGTLVEGDLAKMLYITPSTMSRMVFGLEERGWLKTARDRADRRRVLVMLSDTGKRRMRGMRDKQAEVLARRVQSLGEEQREDVYRVAEFVNNALRYMISTPETDRE
jgi:DNA-binding MarR family transcriptional regulator